MARVELYWDDDYLPHEAGPTTPSPEVVIDLPDELVERLRAVHREMAAVSREIRVAIEVRKDVDRVTS